MNMHDGNVFFLTDFDDNMESQIVVPLIKEIQRQRLLRDGRIDLHINSFGGYAHLVFQIVSYIELAKNTMGITVRTIVPDVALSAGSILAVAGTPGERYIEKSAKHLLHYGITGSAETTPEQTDRNYAEKVGHFGRILKHYEKYSNVPDLAQKMKDDSFYVTGIKAKQWGLADKFMDKFDIGYDY